MGVRWMPDARWMLGRIGGCLGASEDAWAHRRMLERVEIVPPMVTFTLKTGDRMGDPNPLKRAILEWNANREKWISRPGNVISR